MKKISILGCGWLGLPLAKDLITKAYFVNGSTTTKEKLKIIEKEGINPYLIAIENNTIKGDIDSFLSNSTLLIINIPPKLRQSTRENFVQKIKILIPHIEKSSIEKVLFVSSTSVYGDSDTNDIVDEQTIPKPDTESGKQLFEVEKILESNTNFKTTILRFGGLVNENRHPIYSLSGRENIKNSKAPINLIHIEDCIAIIIKIIEVESWNKIFNAVAPFHPTKEEYYTQKARELKLSLPKFDNQTKSYGKNVCSNTLEKLLNYKFKVTSNI